LRATGLTTTNLEGTTLRATNNTMTNLDITTIRASASTVTNLRVTNSTMTNLNVTNPVYRMVPVLARAIDGSNQSVANNTTTTVLFTGIDTLAYSYNSTNTGISYSSGVFTNVSGQTRTYQISYTIEFASNATGQRYAEISNDTSTGRYAINSLNALATGNHITTGSATLVLNNNDTFSIKVYQSSGGALDLVRFNFGQGTKVQIALL